MCLGIAPSSPPPPPPPPYPRLSTTHIHKYAKMHSHIHSLTCTHIFQQPQPLIQRVASAGFWPCLCGAVGRRGGDPGLWREQLQEGPQWAHPWQSRGPQRGVCVCLCVYEGLRGPSPGQRCLSAWALQGAQQTGKLYMEPPLVQTLHSQLHTAYSKDSHQSSIAILTLEKHSQ